MSSGSRMSKRRVSPCRSTISPSYPTLSSAETVAKIDDLVIQILSFLPIKTLLRFKYVSKHWLSLITNPKFSYRIISSKPPAVSGLFLRPNFRSSTAVEYEFLRLDDTDYDNDDDAGDDDDDDENSVRRSVAPPLNAQLRFSDHPSDMIILQSCNGLLLCQCSCPNQYNRNYYVYNPTTKQNTLLPPIKGLSDQVLGISLAFDPFKSPHYKVVCLKTCDRSSDLHQIEVYSSNAGPWRLSGRPFTLPSVVEFKNTLFWNNAVHWFGYWGDCIFFDIEREEIRILPLPRLGPEDSQDTRGFRFLDESRGYLYFVEIYDSSSSQFLVYEMERGGASWSPKYDVDLEPLASAFPEMNRAAYNTDRFFAFSVVCIVREETEDDSYMVLHIPNQAVRYNFKDKTFKKLRDLKPSDEHLNTEFYGINGSFQFVESLACV